MREQLKNIAKLQSGVFAKPGHFGEVKYLQARHFDSNGFLMDIANSDLKLKKVDSHHLLNPGDVLFASKGARNFASVFKEHFGSAAASTTFSIIRLHHVSKNKVEPDYLAWYLNHSASLKTLKLNAKGSSIPSISITDIGEIEIDVPEIEIQNKIVNIHKLHLKLKTLRGKLNELIDIHIQNKLLLTVEKNIK